MKHISEDILLKSTLKLLENGEEASVQMHLSQCDECRNRYFQVKQENEIIGSFDPQFEVEVPPLPKAKKITFMPLLKAAAILAIGFLTGFLVNEWARPNPVNVIPQNIMTKAQVTTTVDYVTCEVDVRI